MGSEIVKKLLASLLVSFCASVFAQSAPTTGQGISQRLKCASTTAAPSSTAYTCSTFPSYTPIDGDFVSWEPGSNDSPNTVIAPTLNVNAAGAKPIVNTAGAYGSLDAGDVGAVTALSSYFLKYDGTNWRLHSHVANTLSTYTNTSGQSLDGFYSALRKTGTQIVRIGAFVDSILTCYQVAPCNFGPFNSRNSAMVALKNELGKVYGLYSTGIRPIWRITGTTTPDGSVEGGYALTSGTLSTSTLIGPQETSPPAAFSGQSLAKLTSGGVLTITVGQAWSKVAVYCATNATSNGWTVTIAGSSAGNICTATPGVATANRVEVTNPVSIATQGATPSTLTFTALGANSYIYAYEAVLTNNNFGLVIDNMGVAAIAAIWWQGLGTDGLVWWDLATNASNTVTALCIMQMGQNDAQGSPARTSALFNADLQVIGTNCTNKGASVLMMVPPPFANTNYTTLQQGMVPYAQTAGWDVLIMSDLFRDGDKVLRGLPDFAAQNTATNTALNQTDGMFSDGQHLTDQGSWAAADQIHIHLFGRRLTPRDGYGNGSQILSRPVLKTAYTNATVTATSIVGWAWPVYAGQTLIVDCDGIYQAAATGGLRFQVTGPAMTALTGALQMNNTAAPNGSVVTAVATLTTSLAVTTATTNHRWDFNLYVNPSASGTIQIQAASVAAVNLTIGVGSKCYAR